MRLCLRAVVSLALVSGSAVTGQTIQASTLGTVRRTADLLAVIDSPARPPKVAEAGNRQVSGRSAWLLPMGEAPGQYPSFTRKELELLAAEQTRLLEDRPGLGLPVVGLVGGVLSFGLGMGFGLAGIIVPDEGASLGLVPGLVLVVVGLATTIVAIVRLVSATHQRAETDARLGILELHYEPRP